jgi:hypothetical protein
MEKNNRSTAYCVAGTQSFIADDVPKTSRKRLLTLLASGCAGAAEIKKTPAHAAATTRAHRTNGFENVWLFIGFYFFVGG